MSPSYSEALHALTKKPLLGFRTIESKLQQCQYLSHSSDSHLKILTVGQFIVDTTLTTMAALSV
jgi:hypothetical protein